MARSGGLFGRVMEAVVDRAAAVAGASSEVAPVGTMHRLREAVGEIRTLVREQRDLGWQAYRHAAGQPQDMEPRERKTLAAKVRLVAEADSNFKLGLRLRNAFCFGRGVSCAKAADPDVQELFEEFWDDPENKLVLTSLPAQLEFGWDLWTQNNVFLTVHIDGFDGKVKLGQLHHDLVDDAVRNGDIRYRLDFYVVTEQKVKWNVTRHCEEPDGKPQTVYYAGLESVRAAAAAKREVTPLPGMAVRPGLVLQVAMNKGRERKFGIPDGKANMRWAAAFNDILAGQSEKAKSAQAFLMKIRSASSPEQLQSMALKAANRRSPLAGTADESRSADDPAALRTGKPGGAWWENEGVKAEPFALDSGGDKAKADLESTAAAFAAGTNFPKHYYYGDPGALAGAMAVELPVLKLTDLDQEVVESGVFRVLFDLVIARAIETGRIEERRPATDEERADPTVEVGPDGMVERDLSYEFAMPGAMRRNLPELVQMIADVAVTFDPQGSFPELQKLLLEKVLRDVFEMPDPGPTVERIYQRREPDAPGTAPADQPPGSVGPDGQHHVEANAYGAQQQARAVESAARALVTALENGDEEGHLQDFVEAFSGIGHGGDG